MLPGCALVVVAAVCASCEASTGDPELVGTSSSALAIAGLFPTGVSATGTRLAVGAIDPHYVLSSNDASFPGPDALTVNATLGWAASGAGSRWISIRASTEGTTGDVYTYTTTFTLEGVNPASATLSGQWACDDSCTLELNGTQVATDPFPAWPLVGTFTVPAGSPFQLGVNTLAFVTSNTTGGPTGLQVLSLSGNASATCDGGGACADAGAPTPDAGSDAGRRQDAGGTADAGEGLDAGPDAGEGLDAGPDASEGLDAGDRRDASEELDAGPGADASEELDAGTGPDASEELDAGERADASEELDAGTGPDATEELDASPGADANAAADAGAMTDASEGDDAGAANDASEGEDGGEGLEGDDAGQQQGGSLQGGGLSCGIARSGRPDPARSAPWLLVLGLAAAARRGRRKR